jgi:hypothetical protein
LENEVTAIRKDETTIPIKLGRKHKIEGATRLQVVGTKEGRRLKPAKSIFDLAGAGAKYATPKKMKKLLDRLREEDV